MAQVEGLDPQAKSMLAHGHVGDVELIDDIIDEPETAGNERANLSKAVFDQSDGHPIRVDIDYSASVIDDEASYRISHFSSEQCRTSLFSVMSSSGAELANC